jgi:hypothetical protein
MTKKTLFTILSLFSLSFGLFAQNEYKNWYFGAEAGLSFESSGPEALLDGKMIALEGTATISDRNGNLLFYTNGLSIYDSTHQIMQNGDSLDSDGSATQAALILKQPLSPNKYFVFVTQSHAQGTKRFSYSIVDMSLNNGKGAVTSDKNVLIKSPVLEKLNSAHHSNCIDSWIMVHEANSNAFYAYQLTEDGLDTLPVVSNAGDTLGATAQDYFGQMKFSSDGKRLANVNMGEKKIQLFDFDNSTGIVSGQREFQFDPQILGFVFYGLEFSANGQILYTPTDQNIISALDLNLPNDSIVVADRFNDTLSDPGIYGALQLDIHGNIFVSLFQDSLMYQIVDADQFGLSQNFKEQSVDLEGRMNSSSLPNFTLALYLRNTDTLTTCEEQPIDLESNFTGLVDWFSPDNPDSIINTTPNYSADPDSFPELIARGNGECKRFILARITPCPEDTSGNGGDGGSGGGFPEDPYEDAGGEVTIPNVFTPGGGPNSLYYFPTQNIQSIDATIVNRWGQPVTFFKTPDDFWDGTNLFTGRQCADGVYYLTYKIVKKNGEQIEGSEFIHLLRKQ